MSTGVLWALVGLGLGVVVVRRRSAAIALLAAQSLLLGAVALSGARDALVIAGLGLVARGVALPALLWRVVRATREPRRVASERFALPRLVLAVAAVVLAAALTPAFGLESRAAGQAAAALVVLGIAIAALRRPVVFQALGFLVAENGAYLAGLAVAGGLPGAVELGLAFDVLVVLAVAAAFGAEIHGQFGTGDTAILRRLRD
jgi:hydrogenase-4 component E